MGLETLLFHTTIREQFVCIHLRFQLTYTLVNSNGRYLHKFYLVDKDGISNKQCICFVFLRVLAFPSNQPRETDAHAKYHAYRERGNLSLYVALVFNMTRSVGRKPQMTCDKLNSKIVLNFTHQLHDSFCVL